MQLCLTVIGWEPYYGDIYMPAFRFTHMRAFIYSICDINMRETECRLNLLPYGSISMIYFITLFTQDTWMYCFDKKNLIKTQTGDTMFFVQSGKIEHKLVSCFLQVRNYMSNLILLLMHI